MAAYFDRIGWPLSVGKGEEPVFARRAHEIKQQHLARMLRGGQVPLRQDVERVRGAGAASAVGEWLVDLRCEERVQRGGTQQSAAQPRKEPPTDPTQPRP